MAHLEVAYTLTAIRSHLGSSGWAPRKPEYKSLCAVSLARVR